MGRAGREGVAITLAEPREHRLLKNIERVTGRRIGVETLPTVADLRARRLALTEATLREAILQDDLEPFRVVVETLSDEFGVMEVALAAVKLAHGEAGGEEIPDAAPPPERAAGGPAERARRRGRAGAPSPGMTRLFIGAGRRAGIRPQDLVGAVTGETRLSGREVGSIEIADRFSLVEVPTAAAEEVVSALRASAIKGRKVLVRREGREEGGRAAAAPRAARSGRPG